MPKPKKFDKEIKILVKTDEYNLAKEYARSNGSNLSEMLRKEMRRLARKQEKSMKI